MAFRLRTVLEITDSILSIVKGRSGIDDTEVGSVNRSLAEGSALQDADQYVQIGKMKSLFNFINSKGEDLDERLADYGEDAARRPPKQAVGQLRFRDTAITSTVSTTVGATATAGDTFLTVASASGLPTTGSVVLDRSDTGKRELVAYTSIAGAVLALATALTKGHTVGASVILSTAGADRVIPVNTISETESDETTDALQFRTTAVGTILDGDAESGQVDAVSVGAGAVFNVASGVITNVVNKPFNTIAVTNEDKFHDGAEREQDEDAIARVLLSIQALPRGNDSALYKAAINTALTSGERVVSAQVVEEFIDPDVSVYIDNGTGTAETTETLTNINEVLVFNASPGRKRAKSTLWPMVSGTAQLVTSVDDVTSGAITGSAGAWVITLATLTPTAGSLVGRFVLDSNHVAHEVTANTGSTITVNSTTAPSTGAVNILSTDLVEGSDYGLTETNGDIQLAVGLASGAALVLQTVQRYTGLIEAAQRTIEGYDGSEAVKACGVKVKVRAPAVQSAFFVIVLSTNTLVEESAVISSVKDAIVAYVNSLGIGEDVVLAEVVAAVMSVSGVNDCVIQSPVSNIVSPDGTITRTSSSNITLL